MQMFQMTQNLYRPTEKGWLLGNELYGRLWDLRCLVGLCCISSKQVGTPSKRSRDADLGMGWIERFHGRYERRGTTPSLVFLESAQLKKLEKFSN